MVYRYIDDGDGNYWFRNRKRPNGTNDIQGLLTAFNGSHYHTVQISWRKSGYQSAKSCRKALSAAIQKTDFSMYARRKGEVVYIRKDTR